MEEGGEEMVGQEEMLEEGQEDKRDDEGKEDEDRKEEVKFERWEEEEMARVSVRGLRGLAPRMACGF